MSDLEKIKEQLHKTGLDELAEELREDLPDIPVAWLMRRAVVIDEVASNIWANHAAGFLAGVLVAWARENKPHCNADYCEIGGGE